MQKSISMNKSKLNAIYDDDLTFKNLYSIFPESGDIKFVCDSPEAVKLFITYINDRKI